ncbi:hypothetical protein VIGAN_11010300 [Vigna angularis var. angularis]|uniref:Uncharacterized protein n=1 Tax=Vigna angularis var. angularis TaxID=157739 RepID=A0A0S3T6V0_PHAAN|nr:hypothetical protein VIGAN_11010300 [Vigna angularis var. angularis]
MNVTTDEQSFNKKVYKPDEQTTRIQATSSSIPAVTVFSLSPTMPHFSLQPSHDRELCSPSLLDQVAALHHRAHLFSLLLCCHGAFPPSCCIHSHHHFLHALTSSLLLDAASVSASSQL